MAVGPDAAPRDPTFEQSQAAVIRSAVEAVSPAIVSIETVGGAQPLRENSPAPIEESFRLADGPTTGLILTPDGLILTSSFNFARDPTVITVRLSDGRRFVASLLGRDSIRRLALLKIDANDLPTAAWAKRSSIRPGRYAIACGRGFGGSVPSASLGIVSALDRRNAIALQTDAKTSPANYGGPLIDIEGRVMGLIVPMAGAGSALAGAAWYDSGIGFALYKDKIDQVLDRLRGGRDIEPGKIGVILAPLEPDMLEEVLGDFLPQARGVRIVVVARESPAADVGLRPEDVITAIDGRPVGDVADIQRRLSDRAAGERISLSIKRRWEKLEVHVTLARVAEIRGFDEPAEAEARPNEEEDEDNDESPTTRPDSD